MKITRSLRSPLLISLFGCIALSGLAEGIPEPYLVLYGTVRNSADNNVRMTVGSLTWQFRKLTDGRVVTVSTALTNINDQFSYVLRVPCETIIAGYSVSSNALALTPTAAVFDRSQVSYGGGAAQFVVTSQGQVPLSSKDRGKMEQLDLLVSVAPVDSDGNGLPDDWETRYFGFVGVLPDADADGDGLTNGAEYRAGTDPTSEASVFKFIHIAARPEGGMLIQWSSVPNRAYVLERSPALLQDFVPIAPITNLTGQSVLEFIDFETQAPAARFYRIRLQP
jgi:hypothetical protein